MALQRRLVDPDVPPSSKRARLAVLDAFRIHGAVFSSWVPLIPTVQQPLGLTPGELGIALVTSTGYLGYLVGPPAIGLTADHLTLRGALGIAAALGLIMAALAPAMRSAPTEAAREDRRGDGPQSGTASDGY